MIDDSPLRRGRQTETTACALKTWPMARSWGRARWRRRKRNLSVSASFKFVFGLDCKYLRIILPDNKSSVMKCVSSILSLVALKSMATGSGKVWGAKLSPKVQRKRVKSKVALLKVRKKKLLAFDIGFGRSTPMNWKVSQSLRDSPSGCRLLISTGERSQKRSLKTKTELLASLR